MHHANQQDWVGLPSGASYSLSLPAQGDPKSIEQWRNPIELAARKSNVPTSVIGGVMHQESRGRDTGLMAKWPHEENILAGTCYSKENYDKLGS
ncbi:unnamed protein product [Adineta ricciae]|uniref:Uncharacterized protein n=1 Tax=Adineta ricciae TaxID=249248 RepID=A0A814Q769_ADIRI|nr:unnamed protein product [Adineta ricciae]CAF1226731.1 unnamed protein product [Adineta ricciae]